MIRGYDVSHHQGVFDHARAVQEGFDFCIVKSTEGATLKDSEFDRNWRRLADVGLTRGAYHFGRPGSNSARTEAGFYLETATLTADDIRPILDLEDFGREALGPRPSPSGSRTGSKKWSRQPGRGRSSTRVISGSSISVS